METRFQTSFIPKKPVASTIGTMSSTQAPRPKNASLFMTLATIIFVLSVLAAGGSYGLNYYLNQSQIMELCTNTTINSIKQTNFMFQEK